MEGGDAATRMRLTETRSSRLHPVIPLIHLGGYTMRKALLMAGALLALTSTVAMSATGVDLAWNACFGQVGALPSRASTCASNTGNQAMYASFNPPAGV